MFFYLRLTNNVLHSLRCVEILKLVFTFLEVLPLMTNSSISLLCEELTSYKRYYNFLKKRVREDIIYFRIMQIQCNFHLEPLLLVIQRVLECLCLYHTFVLAISSAKNIKEWSALEQIRKDRVCENYS